MEVFEGKIPSNVELGQMCFSPNTIHHYDCPDYVVALLRDIARKLDIVMWNSKQKEYDNPFENTGNDFMCDTFEVHAYNWNEDINQPYNFKCDDIEISWYKYLGRGCTMNSKWSQNAMIEMYNKCMKALDKINKEALEDEGFC